MIQPAVYDNEKRYLFSNWTNEDFVGIWGGVPTLIKKGESVELPEYKAFHFTHHLVDREMMKDGKMLLDVQEARQPYEDKTCVELTAGVDSPAMASLKEKIRQELEQGGMKSGDVNVKPTVEGPKEFEDIIEPKVEPKETKKKK